MNGVERREEREKGLCFNCDEKSCLGHHYKGRLFRLSVDETELLEVLGDCKEEEEAETREVTSISLNALEGNMGANTIRMRGTLNNITMIVLIDTSSTHCFIKKRFPLIWI